MPGFALLKQGRYFWSRCQPFSQRLPASRPRGEGDREENREEEGEEKNRERRKIH
jgi:hypothetical protein